MRRKMALVVALLALIGTAAPAAAQGPSTAQGLVPVGGIGGAARAVAVLDDGSILLAEGEALLHLDAGGAPLDRLALGRGAVQDVAAVGGTVYALTEAGLAVVALNPLAEQVFLPGGGQALAVTARAVYVAAQEAGLRVAALGTDGAPGAWGRVETPAAAVDVAVGPQEAYLYVALGESGIGIYDLSAPVSPLPAGQVVDLGPVGAVEVWSRRLYAGAGYRLYLFDLANPAAPILQVVYDPLHDARDVVLRQEWAYVADAAGGLKRYRIDDFSAPRLDQVVWSGTAYGLADDGLSLYVAAGWDGVVVLDAVRRDSLILAGQVALPGEATAVAAARDGQRRWGLAALGPEGVAVLDRDEANQPRLAAVLPLAGAVRAVALRETIGFAAVEGVGVAIFSVADPAAPHLLATVPLEGTPESLIADGTRLYVAAGTGGLYILETIRPAEPSILGRLLPSHAGPFRHVTLEGGKRAYISTGSALIIADVDVPDDPQVLAVVPVPSAAAAARDFIVYAVGGPALTTINAASSNAPQTLGAYRAADAIHAVQARGDQVWLAGQGSGAAAVGLAALEDGTVEELVTVGQDGGGRALAWQGDAALLAVESGALVRLDAAGSHVVRQGISGGRVVEAAADGRLLVGGEGWGVLDLTDPAQPRLVEQGSAPGPVDGLAAASGTIFAAVGDSGVIAADGTATRRWQPGAADGAARDLAAGDGFLYVAEEGPGERGALRVLEAGTLATVTVVPLPGGAQAVAVRDGLAYVGYAGGTSGAQAVGGLAVVDISAPTGGLRRVGGASIPATGLLLANDERTGYAVDGTLLTVFDSGNWPEVRPVRQMLLPQPVTRLAFVGSNLLLGRSPGESLLLLSLFDPLSPAPAAVLPVGVEDAVGVDGMLYLAAGADGLQAVSLVTLADLEQRTVTLDPAPTTALWHDGATLYAAGPATLRAYDLRDPAAPALRASVPLGAAVVNLVGRTTRRDGNWLYLATEAGLLAAHHAPDGTLTLADGPLASAAPLDVLAVTERRVYARSASRLLDVWALAGPSTPEWSVAFPLAEGEPQSVVAWGDRVLVGTATGIAALEWPAGPERSAESEVAASPPSVIGQLVDLPGVPAAVRVGVEGTVWAAGTAGVWQIDVRDPAAPVLRAVLTVPGTPGGIAPSAEGEQVAVAAGACGVRLLDFGGDAPREIGYWRGFAAADVAAVGDLYAVTGEEGVMLLRPAADLPPVMPPMPYAPSPPDRAAEIGSSASLSWLPEPDSCEPVRYEVWVGMDQEPPTLAATPDAPAAVLGDLPVGAAVRWQVVSVDSQGDRAQGPIWQFYTSGAPQVTPQLASLADGRLVLPTPAAIPSSPDQSAQEPRPSMPDLGISVLVALLVGGAAVEAVLVFRLARWWRGRRR